METPSAFQKWVFVVFLPPFFFFFSLSYTFTQCLFGYCPPTHIPWSFTSLSSQERARPAGWKPPRLRKTNFLKPARSTLQPKQHNPAAAADLICVSRSAWCFLILSELFVPDLPLLVSRALSFQIAASCVFLSSFVCFSFFSQLTSFSLPTHFLKTASLCSCTPLDDGGSWAGAQSRPCVWSVVQRQLFQQRAPFTSHYFITSLISRVCFSISSLTKRSLFSQLFKSEKFLH